MVYIQYSLDSCTDLYLFQNIASLSIIWNPAIIWVLTFISECTVFVLWHYIVSMSRWRKMQLLKMWMVSMATTIFTSSSKEGRLWTWKRGEWDHYLASLSLCCTYANSPPERPSTDLVPTRGPSCRGNSHLCILADWPLVSHSGERPSLDLRGCTGIKTWEKKDLDSV